MSFRLWRTNIKKVSMRQELFRPATMAVPLSSNANTVPDAFQRLPVNLSKEEIRAIVRDLLG